MLVLAFVTLIGCSGKDGGDTGTVTGDATAGWPPPRVSTSPHHGAIIGWSAMGKGVGVNCPTAPRKVMLPLLLTKIERYVPAK